MSLRSRLVQLLGLGRSTTAVTDGGKVRAVQMRFPTALDTRDAVPVMQEYGFASRPHAGCDFMVVALDHHPGKSVVIASNDQRYRITLAEGEVALHDDQGQSLHLTRAGIVATDKSGSVIAMADNTITTSPKDRVLNVVGQVSATGNDGTGGTVTGNWVVNGNISATGSITATGDIVAGTVSLKNHVHSDAGGSGDSGPPVPGT